MAGIPAAALREAIAKFGRAAIGARRGGASSLMREAREAADFMDGLGNYAAVTGSLGGIGGMLMSAADEESQGGTPEEINEAALYGGRAGAIGGPLAFGPAVGMTMAAGPAGAAPIVPWALFTGSEGQRPRNERERKRMRDEALRRALEMQINRIDHR